MGNEPEWRTVCSQRMSEDQSSPATQAPVKRLSCSCLNPGGNIQRALGLL